MLKFRTVVVRIPLMRYSIPVLLNTKVTFREIFLDLDVVSARQWPETVMARLGRHGTCTDVLRTLHGVWSNPLSVVAATTCYYGTHKLSQTLNRTLFRCSC